MAFSPTEVADCVSICKAFEKGAAYSVTEESVFAQMTPLLSTTRTQSNGIVNQIETQDAISAPKTTDQKINENLGATPGLATSNAVNTKNLNNSNEDDEGIFPKIVGNFFPAEGQVQGTGEAVDSEIFGNIFNSECIPCGVRLNLLGELDFKAGVDVYLDYWKQWLINHYQNLLGMLNVFKGTDRYIDLCALIDHLKKFVCIPDLSRILSALMALMMQVSFDFNGIFSLVLSLVAPLVQPFLSNFVDMLQRYILLIIKPLECIIDSLQSIIAKLDYNVLFKNIDSLDKHISLGRRQGNVIDTTGKNISKIPFIDIQVDLHEGPDRAFEADFNALDSITLGQVARKNEEDQRAVEQAADELRAIQSQSRNIDGADSAAVERYKTQSAAARKKYRAAVEEKNLSEVGQVNRRIGEFQQGFKSTIYTLIGFIRKAMESVEAFFQDIFDELKKIMGEYFGGSGNYIQMLTEKFVLVQMISWISAIIKAFSSDLHCDDDEEDIKIERIIPAQQGFFVWTDDEGNVTIEEDPDLIEAAVDETVKALGQEPSGLTPDSEVEGQTARQKLKGLIEFTGDPVLDSSIARTTDVLTTPVKLTFKCPLQTTVEQAEQVNTWISELNSI